MMCRFYNHNSSFVHGGIEGAKEGEAVYGQQDIHQKIMQLNFRDCHAKIRKVDSHETLASGVVVQVRAVVVIN
jgi:Ras GTPase-activating protein-binding protein 1